MNWENFLDWGKSFIRIDEGIRLWDILNSEAILLLILLPMGRWANSQYQELKADTSAAEADAAFLQKLIEERNADEEEPDDIVVEDDQTLVGVRDYRAEARQIAENAKTFINKKIKDDPDNRHQRTYGRISGFYPKDRATALLERDQIDSTQEEALVELFDAWRRYEKGHGANYPVSLDVYEKMSEAWKRVEAA